MAYGNDDRGFIHAEAAASIVLPFQPVTLSASAAEYVPLGANTLEPVAVNGNATAARAEKMTGYGEGCIVRAVAGASLGYNADVGVASSNGTLAPVTGASGVTRYRVGKALEPAAAAGRFTIRVSVRQLSNLI
jgi:hypothetical protein